MSIASVWALINEFFMISSAVAAAIGWRYIRRKQVDIHKRWMITSASLGSAFFVSYLAGTVVIGDTMYGGPTRYSMPYQVFLLIHVLLATVAAVLGVITLRLALKARFGKHRKVAPWTIVLWFISAATGLAVYLLLFVVFTPGPSVGNLLHVLTGNPHP